MVRKSKTESRIGMAIIVISISGICFFGAKSCDVCHAQVDMPFDETRVFADITPIDPAPTVQTSPTPVPTPADGSTAEEYYNYILEQSDCEHWVETNYDPVETRNGECIVAKDEVYQSVSADLAVICTHGYNNHYYGDGSGDIRGLWNQGFIGIEGTVVAFRLMDLFISNAYAGSDKWKEAKAIKKLSKIQTKPAKPKKEKWKKSNGLKEKKHDLEGGGQ